MKKIFVAGHRGMVGSAILRELKKNDNSKIICRSRDELDLTDQSAVRRFFEIERPDEVYLAAAKVGGIYANNTFPADFIYENLMIEANVVHSAFVSGVKKLLFLGSSCIYPRDAKQPIDEGQLLSGYLESTNEPYAIAKISCIKLCESYNRQYGDSHGIDYRSIMPTNIYGTGDNYHPMNSHVIPGLIRRFHEGLVKCVPSVQVWGTGQPRREFLYVDDLADASVFIMELDRDTYRKATLPTRGHINVGVGNDLTIKELAESVSDVVGYKGEIRFDATFPDGTPRKLLDSTLIRELGWKPRVDLKSGLKLAYTDFVARLI